MNLFIAVILNLVIAFITLFFLVGVGVMYDETHNNQESSLPTKVFSVMTVIVLSITLLLTKSFLATGVLIAAFLATSFISRVPMLIISIKQMQMGISTSGRYRYMNSYKDTMIKHLTIVFIISMGLFVTVNSSVISLDMFTKESNQLIYLQSVILILPLYVLIAIPILVHSQMNIYDEKHSVRLEPSK